MDGQEATQSHTMYIPISPLMIFPETKVQFSVYLKHGSRYVLYTHERELFTEKHRKNLYDNGTTTVYILAHQRQKYDRYVEENLGNILRNEDIPIEQRARIFYDSSASLVKEVLEGKLPPTLGNKVYEKLLRFVSASTRFLSLKDSLRSISSLISHDYRSYTHSIQVFVYSMTVLGSYEMEDAARIQCGLGALLHDIGKTQVPKTILNKNGSLTAEEWTVMHTHPVRGVGMCSLIPLTQEALNIILFHHEKMNGTGYPAGMAGEAIPLAVRVTTLADVYDALTSNRPYAKSCSPFEALRVMQNDMRGSFDPEAFKRFILTLSDAQIV